MKETPSIRQCRSPWRGANCPGITARRVSIETQMKCRLNLGNWHDRTVRVNADCEFPRPGRRSKRRVQPPCNAASLPTLPALEPADRARGIRLSGMAGWLGAPLSPLRPLPLPKRLDRLRRAGIASYAPCTPISDLAAPSYPPVPVLLGDEQTNLQIVHGDYRRLIRLIGPPNLFAHGLHVDPSPVFLGQLPFLAHDLA